jgi:hypothetical protein
MDGLFAGDIWEQLEAKQVANPALAYIESLQMNLCHASDPYFDGYGHFESSGVLTNTMCHMVSSAPTYFSKLRWLCLSNFPTFQVRSLVAIVSGFPSLQYLQIDLPPNPIGGGKLLTDEFLETTGQCCALKSLSVVGHKLFTLDGILTLLSDCRTLVELNIIETNILGSQTQIKSRVKKILDVAADCLFLFSYTGSSYTIFEERKAMDDVILRYPYVLLVDAYCGCLNHEAISKNLPSYIAHRLQSPYQSLAKIVQSTLLSHSGSGIEDVCSFAKEEYPDSKIQMTLELLQIERTKLLTAPVSEQCGKCRLPATFVCGCHKIKYCCQEHQKSDWDIHKYHCRAFRKFPLQQQHV